MTDHRQPLKGIRVLDFSQNLPGPYATLILQSLGAEVVKVEPPKGDPGRHIQPFFDIVNRGKQSIVLDLRDPEHQAHLPALVKWADVLVEGFRPGVMARLGCGPEQATALNPRLIYVSISAYGQTGPLASAPAHDLNCQALTGVTVLETDGTGPRGAMLPVADLSTSLNAVAAINAALLARGTDGPGTVLDLAMTDAAWSWAQLWGDGIDLGGQGRKASAAYARPVRSALDRGLFRTLDQQKLYALPHYGVFLTRDHRHIAIGVVDEKHFWASLCDVLGLKRLSKLPMPARAALGPVLRKLVARKVRRWPLATLAEALETAGVPANPVLNVEQAREHPQLRGRNRVESSGWARMPLPQSAGLDAPAPTLGQHTHTLLEQIGRAP